MKVAYFAETISRNQDGIPNVIYETMDDNLDYGIESFFVTAVGEPISLAPYGLTPSLPLPSCLGGRMPVCTVSQLARLLESFQPDLLHIHAPFLLGWAATRLARRLGIPCVATYHTHLVSHLPYYGAGFLQPLLHLHNRWLYNACEVTLVASRSLQCALQEQGVNNTAFLPQGVDIEKFHPRFRTRAWRNQFPDKKTVLLCVGRLAWEKNLSLLSQVLHQLFEQRDDFAFVFIGEGPARRSLQQQLPKAHFLGMLTGAALSEAYASSDVLVFPSATETCGRIALEAMASGLPCVVADAGGVIDFVEHLVTGLRFQPNRRDDLKEAINQLLDSEALRKRLAEQALSFARSHDKGDMLASQGEIYAQILEDRRWRMEPFSS